MVIGELELEALEHVAGRALVIVGEVLVEDEYRLDPRVLEEGVPVRLLDHHLVEQVLDRAVVEAKLRTVLLQEALVGRLLSVLDAGAAAVVLLAPGRRLHRLPQRDRLANLVRADDPDEA